MPQLYFDYLRSGDARPLKGVFYHNAMDVVALAALFSHVTGLLEDPLVIGREHGEDLAALGRLYEDLGRPDQAAKIYHEALAGELTEPCWWIRCGGFRSFSGGGARPRPR